MRGSNRLYILFFIFFVNVTPPLSTNQPTEALLGDAVPFLLPPRFRVCQCGSWCGILSAVYSCCGWLVKARNGRQLVIRLIMLPLCEVGPNVVIVSDLYCPQEENLLRLNVLNVVRDVLHNA